MFTNLADYGTPPCGVKSLHRCGKTRGKIRSDNEMQTDTNCGFPLLVYKRACACISIYIYIHIISVNRV